MSASLSFGALMIDESSTNMQVHQEQMAQKVHLYPDNDLYACLEFEYNAAEARRNAAKQLYRTYLESDGQYQSVVNEAGAGAAVAGVVAIIAACIALIIKLFARKTGNDIDTTINQLKAMNQSLARKNDTIQTDDPHYNDEMTIRMPDVSLFAINSIDFHLDLIMDSDAQKAMIELTHIKDESKIKEIVEHFRERMANVVKDEDSSIRKQVYGNPESATFNMIDESGPAGELYNKYISKYASKIVGFGDDFDKFIKDSQKIVKDLEARKSRVSSWGVSKDGDSKAVADAKAEVLKAYGDGIQSLINVYGKHGMAIKGAMKRVSQVVLQFQRKFNRIDDETRRKLYKMSEAAFDNLLGEASLMEESSPLHYRSINALDYEFESAASTLSESSDEFDGLFSIDEGVGVFAIISAAIAAIIAIITKLIKGGKNAASASSPATKPLPKDPVPAVTPHREDHSSIEAATSTVAAEKRKENAKRIKDAEIAYNNAAKLHEEAKARIHEYYDEKRISVTIVRPISSMYTVPAFIGRMTNNLNTTIHLIDKLAKQDNYDEGNFIKAFSSSMKNRENEFNREFKSTFGMDPDEIGSNKIYTTEVVEGTYKELVNYQFYMMNPDKRNSLLMDIKDSYEKLNSFMKSYENDITTAIKSFMKEKGIDDPDNSQVKQLQSICSGVIQRMSSKTLAAIKQLEEACYIADNYEAIMAAVGDAVNQAYYEADKLGGKAWEAKDKLEGLKQKLNSESAMIVEEAELLNQESQAIYNEESFIHGEPFNGDTLYDEEDYQDFNRTDWINLGLGEHYKDLENQSRIEEAAFKQECLYRSQPGFSFEKLQRLNEEVAETSKKGWARAMDTLKELIQKFIEKLYGAFGSNKPYLDRYKNSIIDGQTPAVPFTSTGDIFVGMDRIMNVGVPLLNYQQMKNDLGDQGTFYAKHILPEFAKGKNGGRWSRFMKRNFQHTSDGKGGVQINIAGDSKEYFGYGNENNKNEWQLSDLTKDDWQEIFNWLYDVKKIRDSIKKDQRTIEDSIRRIDTELKKAQKLKDDAKNGTSEKPNTEVNTDPKQADVQPQQNAAYSYVYGRMFTEAEIGDAPAASGGDNAAPQATNTTGKGYNDTNAAMKDINSTNPDSTEAVRTAMNNYLAVVKAVLTAKMSALEFIRKELFQIVRYKVQFNQRQNGQQQQQPAQGQQQTHQTQQQQTIDNGNRQNRKR